MPTPSDVSSTICARQTCFLRCVAVFDESLQPSQIRRRWRAHGLQPHRICQFKRSKDPEFVDKLRDVGGLDVDLPAHAVVLGVDEKSQI